MGEIVFLEILKQCGHWPVQASTLFFFLFPKSVTSERPIALLPILIWWWEWFRAPFIQEWKKKRRPRWDALSEMEKFFHDVEDMDQGADTLVVDSAKAFEIGTAKSSMGLDNASRLTAESILGVFSAPAKGAC